MKPCPICGSTGPWKDGRGRMTHIRAHHTTDCPDRGKTVNVVGLGAHRRHVHGHSASAATPADEPQPAAPEPEPAAAPPAAAEPERVGPPQYVRCPDCGKAVRAGRGLEVHRTAMHRPIRPRAQPPARRAADARAVTAALTELLPGAAPELLDRLSAFVEKHQPERGTDRLLVTVVNRGGPWLCPAATVGLVVAREHAAAVVVSLDDVYAHLGHHQPDDLERAR